MRRMPFMNELATYLLLQQKIWPMVIAKDVALALISRLKSPAPLACLYNISVLSRGLVH